MLTEQEKKRFVAHLRYWRDKLNLSNQYIYAEYTYDGLGGEANMNHDYLVSSINVGKIDEVWTVPVVARHEMLELLLEPIYALHDREISHEKSQRAGHEVIHRLENILPLPTDKEVGFVGKKKSKKAKPVEIAKKGKKGKKGK